MWIDSFMSAYSSGAGGKGRTRAGRTRFLRRPGSAWIWKTETAASGRRKIREPLPGRRRAAGICICQPRPFLPKCLQYRKKMDGTWRPQWILPQSRTAITETEICRRTPTGSWQMELALSPAFWGRQRVTGSMGKAISSPCCLSTKEIMRSLPTHICPLT